MIGSQAIQHTASIAGYEIGVPEIFRFGYAHFQSAVATTDDWSEHSGAELVFLMEGEACWDLDDTLLVPLGVGQCALFPSEIRHRITNGIYPPSTSFWMVMTPASENRATTMLTESNRNLFENALGRNGLIQNMSDQTVNCITSVMRLLKDKRVYTGEPLLISELRAHLHLIMVETWKAQDQKQEHNSLDQIVDIALERMHADPSNLPRISELAEELGCTRGHLHTVFRRNVGMSPSDYVQRLKVKRACELLTIVGDSITDIAHNLGYASSQHFAKTFRRYLGLTPTEYRKQRDKRRA